MFVRFLFVCLFACLFFSFFLFFFFCLGVFVCLFVCFLFRACINHFMVVSVALYYIVSSSDRTISHHPVRNCSDSYDMES